MKLSQLIVLICTLLAVSACIVEPYGGGGQGYYYGGGQNQFYRGSQSQYSSGGQYQHDYGRRVWQ